MQTVALFPIQKTKHSKLHEVDINNAPFGKVFSDHILIADYVEGKWRDARIVPYGDITISPATSALHYGQSIFEGLKADRHINGKNICLFRPEANFLRMNISAERMCMPSITEEIFIGGIRELLNLDRDWVPTSQGCSLYIRPFMFATDPYIGMKPSQTYKFMIFTSPVGAYYSAPVKVKVEQHYTRAVKGGTGYAKFSGNYAASMYPTKLAAQQGYDQIIWTDGQTHQFIEEAGTMNIMFVIDGKLITPATGDSILKGVTRDSVLTIARQWGMTVEERPVPVAEVIDAIKTKRLQEAFGAGTAATIAHISVIGHEGVDYTLPPIHEREFSNKVYRELYDIKHGIKPDPYGWVHVL
ncbi:MAG: branched-chain amino acid aminotransferase [Cytophagales bacterium]|nr:branched-chain amino acid aminotransferase [Cytophagales bacterium]MDW8384232.1 branched-chain amino acid aminotransferase [Flammeovirgaceae bacterium]